MSVRKTEAANQTRVNLMARAKRRSYLSRRGYVGYRTRVELVREGAEQYVPVRIRGPGDVFELLRHAAKADRECLYSVMLDSSMQVVGCEEVSRGSLNTTRTAPRELFKSAILANALGIIAAHNHPSGGLEPSADDVLFSKTMKAAGELLGIELYDSLIVTGDGYTSLKERGLL